MKGRTNFLEKVRFPRMRFLSTLVINLPEKSNNPVASKLLDITTTYRNSKELHFFPFRL